MSEQPTFQMEDTGLPTISKRLGGNEDGTQTTTGERTMTRDQYELLVKILDKAYANAENMPTQDEIENQRQKITELRNILSQKNLDNLQNAITDNLRFLKNLGSTKNSVQDLIDTANAFNCNIDWDTLDSDAL